MATPTTRMTTRPSSTKSVDAFLAALPADKRAALTKLRAAIKAAAPAATAHCTFYLMSYDVMRSHAADMKGYTLGKGSIQFPSNEPIPATLVTKLVKARIAEVGKRP